jgi:hypothetical protein
LGGTERQYELASLPAVIGKRNVCQVVVDTPDVSLAHALLFTMNGCPVVFDLGSRSGTYVNGDRVTLAWLCDGDRLGIGGDELALSWEGPHYQTDDAAAAAADAMPLADQANGPTAHIITPGIDDLSAMIEGLKAQIANSQEQLRERAAALGQREAELEVRRAELENAEAGIAAEQRRVEQRASELEIGLSGLRQEQERFEAERTSLRNQHSQLEAQRAELQQRVADFEATAGTLEQREIALQQQQAALEAREQKLTQQQAQLAEREAANTQAAQRIKQFKDALIEARLAFASVQTSPDQQADRGSLYSTGNPAPDSENGDLPAPMVNQPLFGGLDAGSAKQAAPDSALPEPGERGVSGRAPAS